MSRKKKENLLRTGTWQRATVFYIFTIIVATILLPTLIYLITTFFETFDIQKTLQFSINDIILVFKENKDSGQFMVAAYGLISLLYWAIYMNALIRARMLRNKDGNPESAGNKEYGSSYFLDIEDPEICDFSCSSVIAKPKLIVIPKMKWTKKLSSLYNKVYQKCMKQTKSFLIYLTKKLETEN